MMSFTADGQLDPDLLKQRDELFGVNTAAIRDSRADWAADGVRPTPHPAADHPWTTGQAWTTTMQLQEAKVAGSAQAAAAEVRQRERAETEGGGESGQQQKPLGTHGS